MARTLKITTWLGYGLIGLAIVVNLDKFPLALPRREWLALALGGVGICFSFMDALITGRVVFQGDVWQDATITSYRGLAGRLLGLLAALAGGATAVLAARAWANPGTAWDWARTPAGIGAILTWAGSFLAMLSFTQMIGPLERRSQRRYWLVRVAWMGVLIAGGIVVSAGLLQLLRPGLISAKLRQIIPPLPTPPVFPGDKQTAVNKVLPNYQRLWPHLSPEGLLSRPRHSNYLLCHREVGIQNPTHR